MKTRSSEGGAIKGVIIYNVEKLFEGRMVKTKVLCLEEGEDLETLHFRLQKGVSAFLFKINKCNK